MKITRRKTRITVSCTDTEFEILGIAIDQLEAGDPASFLPEFALRQSWADRVRQGPFLNIDHDKRSDAP